MKQLLSLLLILGSFSTMAQKITDLPAATGTGVGGVIPIVQGGVTKRIFIDSLPKLDTTSIYSKISQNTTAISTKQPVLISGINLNTVNGISLLGANNIVIAGASSKALYKDLTLVAGGITPFNFDSSSTAKLTTSGLVNIDITGSVATGSTGILAVTQSAAGNDTLRYNGVAIGIAKQPNKTSLVGFVKLASSFIFSVDTTNISIGQTGGFDADALALFTAASTNTSYKNAVNAAIVSLKGITLSAGGTAWSKSVMINGRAGSTLTQQSFNWRNPAQYQSTYVGTFSYNAAGTQFDGTNYINTGITPSTAFTGTTADIAIVNVVGANTSPYNKIFGTGDASSSISIWPEATTYTYSIHSQPGLTGSPSATGRFISFYSNATTLNAYRNAVSIDTRTVTPSATFLTYPLFDGAGAYLGSNSAPSNARIDVTQVMNTKLTTSEAQAIDAVWATYETALSR